MPRRRASPRPTETAGRGDDAPASKTRRKRRMHELQSLGESLLTLGDADLATIPAPPELLDAVREARRITRHGALARQKQYIGKLMRNVDAAPIEEALARLRDRERRRAARFHRVEAWRDRLVADGDEALAALLEELPGADRQHLRRLMREARREREAGKAPRASRELFRYLASLT